MIPFYIYYSMFGFQRVGDLAWAAGDMRARGFLLGGTAGRTTLNGEGLQHEDGHSHILSSTIPNCVSYDPTFAYELAVIIQTACAACIDEQEDVFYYITVMNENYAHPPMPDGRRGGHPQRHVSASKRRTSDGKGPRVQLLGQRRDTARGDRGRRTAGEGLRCRRRHLERHELHRAAREARGGRALEPAASARAAARAISHASCLGASRGPVIASTDYMKMFAEQIRPFVRRTLSRARHRWLRPLGYRRKLRAILRGRSPFCRRSRR